MLQYSIARRLVVVSAVVVGVASLGGAIGVYSIWSIGAQFRVYEDIASDALLASEFNADMAKVLSNAREYIATRNAESLAATRRYIAESKEGLASAQRELHAPEGVALVGKIAQTFAQFESGFERLVILLVERDRIVVDVLDTIGPQIRKSLSDVVAASALRRDYETAVLAGAIQEDLLTARLYAAKYLLNGRQEDAERVVTEFGELGKQINRLADRLTGGSSDGVAESNFKTTRSLLDQYRKSFAALRQTVDELNNIRTTTLAGNGETINRWASEIKTAAVRSEDELSNQLATKIARDEITILAVVIFAFLFGGYVVSRYARRMSRPIMDLVEQMRALAAGDTNIRLVQTTRRDEIGEMVRAVAVFRDNAIERVRLEDEHAALNKVRAARQDRLEALVRDFEGASRSALSSVGDNSLQVDLMSQLLTEIANNTVDNISSAAAGSEQASANVEKVAAASANLSQSIDDIEAHVHKTAQVVAQATTVASAANQKVERLADSAREIGNVATIIRDVAEQTNLLALNATIEAARAGTAGRGFAVVASEVKALSSQTGSATDLITSQIKAVQSSAAEVVDAIAEIARIMAEADAYAASIAAVIEQQSVDAGSIRDSVQRAAAGTRHASSNLKQISGSAAETSKSAAQVMQASSEVAARTRALGDQINSFLKNVAAA